MPEIVTRKLRPDDDTDPSLDVRAASRLPCPDRPAVRLVASPDLTPVPARARDISVRGIGLLVDAPIAPGTPLAVLWEYGPAPDCRTVRLVAAHLTPCPGGGW